MWVKAMRHPLRSKALVLFAFFCFAGITSRAQDPATTVPTGQFKIDCAKPEEVEVVCIHKVELKDYQQTLHERFGRAFEYKFERDEQPAFALGSTTLLNTEHYLNQHSLTFKFSELFPTPSNIGSIVTTFVEDKYSSPKVSKPGKLEVEGCDGVNMIITCLFKDSKLWQRALSGVTVSGSIGEWQGVEQGVVANESVFPHYGKGGEIDFDPKNLFLTASDWKSVLDAIKKTDKEYKEAPGLSSKAAGVRLVEALIPKFQFKRTSQFDFAKNTGILIPSPFPESGLNSYTFTWNLNAWIKDGATRIATRSILPSQDQKLAAQPARELGFAHSAA